MVAIQARADGALMLERNRLNPRANEEVEITDGEQFYWNKGRAEKELNVPSQDNQMEGSAVCSQWGHRKRRDGVRAVGRGGRER